MWDINTILAAITIVIGGVFCLITLWKIKYNK